MQFIYYSYCFDAPYAPRAKRAINTWSSVRQALKQTVFIFDITIWDSWDARPPQNIFVRPLCYFQKLILCYTIVKPAFLAVSLEAAPVVGRDSNRP